MAFDAQRSVQPVGIAPGAKIVVNVQNAAWKHVVDPTTGLRAYYWAKGHRHVLSHARAWLSWQATGVSDNGAVVGYAITGSRTAPSYHVVRWSSPSAGYRVLENTGTQYPYVVLDGTGDVAWRHLSGYSVAQTPAGVRYELDQWAPPVEHHYNQNIPLYAASSHSIFGGGRDGLISWRIPRSGASGSLLDTVVKGANVDAGGGTELDAVGRTGAVLIRSHKRSYFVSAHGHRVQVAAMSRPLYPPLGAIDSSARLAFTAKGDKRVHFLTCR